MIGSAEEFVRLRSSECMEDYRRAAAEEAPLEVWREVIAEYPDMREWVAHNKTVPIEVIEILARDPTANVRHTIARKRRTPPHVLEQLARDTDDSVRLAVACNPKIPRGLLEFLLNDKWAEVRVTAASRLSQ